MRITSAICGVWNTLRAARRQGWFWLRQVSGDAAYENYLRSLRRASLYASEATASAQPLSTTEFYLDALRRRYSSISRCC